jgi:hypothetical protein
MLIRLTSDEELASGIDPKDTVKFLLQSVNVVQLQDVIPNVPPQ